MSFNPNEITADELVWQRAEAQTRMPSTLFIDRPNTGGASDGAGGVADSAGDTRITGPNDDGSFPCKISPASAKEQDIASKLTELFVWNVRLPALTDCQMRDKLQVPGGQPASLEVIQVLTRPDTEIQRVVLAVESR